MGEKIIGGRNLLLRFPSSDKTRVLWLEDGCEPIEVVSQVLGIPSADFWLTTCSAKDSKDVYISMRLRLLGGKGGFGSQLRAQGNRMSSRKRAGGYESCRDLSGRRLRTINQSKLVADYLRRKPELDRKREIEIREKMLKAIEAPDRKPIFSDVDYLRTARETVDNVEMAVYEAMLKHGDEEEDEDEDERGKTRLVMEQIGTDGASTSAAAGR